MNQKKPSEHQINFTAIVLAGGMGTRLQSVVADRPKPMAFINGKPFLAYLLESLIQQGADEIILAVGHMSEIIAGFFQDRFLDIPIKYSYEDELLGTGGAIRQALSHSSKSTNIVLNGDSWLDMDYQTLVEEKTDKDSPMRLVLTPMTNFDRYGTVTFDESGLVQSFQEKQFKDAGYINAGIYLIDRDWYLAHSPIGKFSLETELLPKMVELGLLKASVFQGFFIDIGIPEDYQRAKKMFLGAWTNAAPWFLFLDRDGVINQRIPNHYIQNTEEFKWCLGNPEAIAALSKMAERTFVVTNQAGIGKKILSEENLEKIHGYLIREVASLGGTLDGVFYCPHLATDHCDCRKPQTGMGYKASEIFPEIDFTRSIMVGDSISDIQFGQKLGMVTVLIHTKSDEYDANSIQIADIQCDSLADLVDLISFSK